MRRPPDVTKKVAVPGAHGCSRHRGPQLRSVLRKGNDNDDMKD